MWYFRCPTCKTWLANKQLPYEKELELICKDSKLTNAEKDIAKRQLLDAVELIRPCCRMRGLGTIELIKVIK